ncbi:hypothetical protein JMJ77_0007391, partial [Colletotrichum scovillei]
ILDLEPTAFSDLIFGVEQDSHFSKNHRSLMLQNVSQHKAMIAFSKDLGISVLDSF